MHLGRRNAVGNSLLHQTQFGKLVNTLGFTKNYMPFGFRLTKFAEHVVSVFEDDRHRTDGIRNCSFVFVQYARVLYSQNMNIDIDAEFIRTNKGI